MGSAEVTRRDGRAARGIFHIRRPARRSEHPDDVRRAVGGGRHHRRAPLVVFRVGMETLLGQRSADCTRCGSGIIRVPAFLSLAATSSLRHSPRHQSQRKKDSVVQRPSGTNAFEFVVVSALRAAQLMRGCIPRVERAHKVITTAQIEVATGKVFRLPPTPLVVPVD
jgi:hypothetical protein